MSGVILSLGSTDIRGVPQLVSFQLGLSMGDEFYEIKYATSFTYWSEKQLSILKHSLNIRARCLNIWIVILVSTSANDSEL